MSPKKAKAKRSARSALRFALPFLGGREMQNGLVDVQFKKDAVCNGFSISLAFWRRWVNKKIFFQTKISKSHFWPFWSHFEFFLVYNKNGGANSVTRCNGCKKKLIKSECLVFSKIYK